MPLKVTLPCEIDKYEKCGNDGPGGCTAPFKTLDLKECSGCRDVRYDLLCRSSPLHMLMKLEGIAVDPVKKLIGIYG